MRIFGSDKIDHATVVPRQGRPVVRPMTRHRQRVPEEGGQQTVPPPCPIPIALLIRPACCFFVHRTFKLGKFEHNRNSYKMAAIAILLGSQQPPGIFSPRVPFFDS
jgi:hypothetical protein